MHNIINQFLFLSAIALQTVTGFRPIIWREPKRKIEKKNDIPARLKEYRKRLDKSWGKTQKEF